MDETTLAGPEKRWNRQNGGRSEVFALCLIWCGHTPSRVGEILLVDTFGSGFLGRGEVKSPGRLRLRQIRPGRSREMGPLESPSLSRKQLKITMQREGIQVQNVGRCRMQVDGVETSESVLVEGQTLEVVDELVFLCVRTVPFFEKELAGYRHEFGAPDRFGLVGESAVLWDLRDQIERVSIGTSHVLISGPSGTGKELVAGALHQNSSWSGKALVARNAATIPEALMDAELFGNIRDYPNAGMPERMGIVGAANGSTLFLDEVGELAESLQAHLLRVLDGGEYQRLGDPSVRRSKFRLIGATNRETSALKEDVLARFRVRLELAGLDARRQDIPLLVVHLLRKMADEYPEIGRRFFDGSIPRIAPGLMCALVTHTYTTHIRELDRILWACTEGSAGDYVEIVSGCGLQIEAVVVDEKSGQAALDKEVIERCLEKHQWNQSKVWPELGLRNRHQLARLMKKHGIHSGRSSA